MQHYLSRLFERIINTKSVSVGFEVNIGNYKKVGDYIIPQAIKDKINSNIAFLENYKFDNQSYAVELIEFNIEKQDIINYKEGDNRKNLPFVIVDYETESNGDKLYAIIRKGKIVTIYLGKSYVNQTLEKLRVDIILKIEEL